VKLKTCELSGVAFFSILDRTRPDAVLDRTRRELAWIER
jgi:hypothetical protein